MWVPIVVTLLSIAGNDFEAKKSAYLNKDAGFNRTCLKRNLLERKPWWLSAQAVNYLYQNNKLSKHPGCKTTVSF